MAKAKKIESSKAKKKRWFPVYTSKDFGERFIGEIPALGPESLIKKTLKINLMNVTGNPKNQNTNLKFEITNIEAGRAYATPVSYVMIPSTLKRLIRRRKTRIDDSFTVLTADKKLIRVKPLILTNSLVTKSVHSALRTLLRNSLTELVSKTKYADLYDHIIGYQIQRTLRNILKKVHPLSICEIRSIELVREKTFEKKEEVKPEEKPAVAEKEEPKVEEKKEEAKAEEKPVVAEKEEPEVKKEEKPVEKKEKPAEKKEVKKEKPAAKKKKETKTEKKTKAAKPAKKTPSKKK